MSWKGTSDAMLQAILRNQVPGEEKLAQADFTINTDGVLSSSFSQICSAVSTLRETYDAKWTRWVELQRELVPHDLHTNPMGLQREAS